MNPLVRFGISMERDLLQKFDTHIKETGYQNRSEAIRDIVRDRLVQKEWEEEKGDHIGTITLIYDHHTPNISSRITKIQHRHHPLVITTSHVHLEDNYCLEVMIVKGDGAEIRKFSNFLSSLRGVKHGKLVMTASSSTFYD